MTFYLNEAAGTARELISPRAWRKRVRPVPPRHARLSQQRRKELQPLPVAVPVILFLVVIVIIMVLLSMS